MKIRVLLEVYHEITHVLGQLCVSSCGLLVDEPAVETVVFRHFNEFVRNGKGRTFLLHQVPDPLYLASVSRGRKKNGAVYRHSVPVTGIYDSRIGGKYQPLPGTASPEGEMIDVLPVIEGIHIDSDPPLGRITAGGWVHYAQSGNSALIHCSVGVALGISIGSGTQFDAASVVGSIGVAVGSPG